MSEYGPVPVREQSDTHGRVHLVPVRDFDRGGARFLTGRPLCGSHVLFRAREGRQICQTCRLFRELLEAGPPKG